VTAVEEMSAALLAMVDHHQTPPCADNPDRWTSDDHDTRASAATLCQSCPLVTPCGRYATEIRAQHGVWGGVDMTRGTRQATT
jgi:Transcription factor WhiB